MYNVLFIKCTSIGENDNHSSLRVRRFLFSFFETQERSPLSIIYINSLRQQVTPYQAACTWCRWSTDRKSGTAAAHTHHVYWYTLSDTPREYTYKHAPFQGSEDNWLPLLCHGALANPALLVVELNACRGNPV